jgi:hypothetical protein
MARGVAFNPNGVESGLWMLDGEIQSEHVAAAGRLRSAQM